MPEAPEALPDYYEVLGVPSDAPAEVIKAAFRQKALVTHPDKPGGSDEAFRRVMQAFTVLFTNRTAYDAQRTQEPAAKRRKTEIGPNWRPNEIFHFSFPVWRALTTYYVFYWSIRGSTNLCSSTAEADAEG